MIHTEIHTFCLVKRAMAVLCLLLRWGRPARGHEIATLLALSPKTTRRHLALLAAQGLICREARGWLLTDAGRQLLLGEGQFLPPASAPQSQKSPFKATTASTASRESNRLTAEAAEEGDRWLALEGEGNERKVPVGEPVNSAGRFEANLRALREEGVGESPPVRQVCRMAHVSPEYIHAQADRLRREGRFQPALLIHVIRCKDPLPPPTGDEQDGRRYICGAYADLIQH